MTVGPYKQEGPLSWPHWSPSNVRYRRPRARRGREARSLQLDPVLRVPSHRARRALLRRDLLEARGPRGRDLLLSDGRQHPRIPSLLIAPLVHDIAIIPISPRYRAVV